MNVIKLFQFFSPAVETSRSTAQVEISRNKLASSLQNYMRAAQLSVGEMTVLAPFRSLVKNHYKKLPLVMCGVGSLIYYFWQTCEPKNEPAQGYYLIISALAVVGIACIAWKKRSLEKEEGIEKFQDATDTDRSNQNPRFSKKENVESQSVLVSKTSDEEIKHRKQIISDVLSFKKETVDALIDVVGGENNFTTWAQSKRVNKFILDVKNLLQAAQKDLSYTFFEEKLKKAASGFPCIEKAVPRFLTVFEKNQNFIKQNVNRRLFRDMPTEYKNCEAVYLEILGLLTCFADHPNRKCQTKIEKEK